MSVEVGRRVFVGSVVAGFPLLAGGDAGVAWAQRQSGAPLRDPIALQLVADMKSSVRRLSRVGSGEQTRRLASSLRLLATWGASNQFDARIKETLRGVIAREGRDALLRREVDPVMFLAEARELGFDGTNVVPLPNLPTIDVATRQKVINDLLANGTTRTWRQLAATLEEAAGAMDRQAALRRPGARFVAQVDPSACQVLSQQMFYLTTQSAFWCAPWFWWVPEPCGLATSALLGISAVYWWRGCV